MSPEKRDERFTPAAAGESPQLDSRVRFASATRAARAGSDLVLLHLERGTYYTLNETGAFAWERFDGRTRLGEIRAAIVERFEVDAAQAWQDLAALVEELVAEGLAILEPEPEGGP